MMDELIMLCEPMHIVPVQKFKYGMRGMYCSNNNSVK